MKVCGIFSLFLGTADEAHSSAKSYAISMLDATNGVNHVITIVGGEISTFLSVELCVEVLRGKSATTRAHTYLCRICVDILTSSDWSASQRGLRGSAAINQSPVAGVMSNIIACNDLNLFVRRNDRGCLDFLPFVIETTDDLVTGRSITTLGSI